MSKSLSQRVHAQFKKVLKDNNRYYTCVIDPENIKIWYVLVKNLPEPYIRCEYYFKIELPDNFPEEPPTLIALTPNGVMLTGGQVCVSVGVFHKNDHMKSSSRGHYGWNPSLGISGFVLQGIVNALLCFNEKDVGVRLKNESNETKNKLAIESSEYNMIYNERINDLFEIHKEQFPDLEIYKD